MYAVVELARFVDEVRTFLDEKLSAELRRAGALCAGIYADQPVALQWHRILNEQGWAVPSWPQEYGGTGWSLEQHAIFQRELTLATAPPISPNSTRMVGPVVIEYGSPAQKSHYLPRIRTGEDWWAQGYSEPGAGSDLASLQCAAVRDGDDYVINGSKIWTTHAHWSNKIFALVRTDASGKPQQGISFLLFDLDLPGIEIKPLISISGDHEFNQVFFTDVRVPVSGLLGEEHKGWTVAKYLLQHERGGKHATALGTRLRQLQEFLAAEHSAGKTSLLQDADFLRKLRAFEIELTTFGSFENRVFSAVLSGEPVGSMSSALKVRSTELRQQITELVIEASAYYGLAQQTQARDFNSAIEPLGSIAAAKAMPQYLNDRAATIYAGSNEIQRNIMAKAVLGL
ncbi:MAG: acyl-CoA dehydrogenase family protein [Pseudomonadales bacterium]